MSDDTNTPADQKTAEAEVERFHDQLGPFVVAAERTRMAMLFTNAKMVENPIVFANDAFLQLTGFARGEVLGASFLSLVTRGAGSEAVAQIEAAFAGLADSEPEICYRRRDARASGRCCSSALCATKQALSCSISYRSSTRPAIARSWRIARC